MQQPTATEAAWSEHVVCMQESSAYCSTVHNVAAMPNGAPKGAVACPKRVQLGDHALQCSLISRTPFDTQQLCTGALWGQRSIVVCMV